MASKVSRSGRSKYEVSQRSREPAGLDVRLEALVDAATDNLPIDSAFVRESADGRQVVDVIAELKDPQVSVPGLQVMAAAGHLVTGAVDLDQVKSVASHENVVKLTCGERVYPELNVSTPEVRARPVDLRTVLPVGTNLPDGAGVIVGIVDFGCDFLHRNFQTAGGRTRILSFWDQSGMETNTTPAPQPYGFGREITASDLNQALENATNPPSEEENPLHPDDFDNGAYQFLNYRPSVPVALDGDPAHGTHVMDIAAGNGQGSQISGIAPKADIIFVQLRGLERDPARESFGSSTDLINAVDYVFRKAKSLGRPAVVNISLGTYGGPHDGSTPAERFFDELLAEKDRAIVVAAGNSHNLGIHAKGEVSRTSPRDLTWRVRNTRVTDNEMEIWYPNGDPLEVTLVDPEGDAIGPIRLNEPDTEIKIGGRVVMILRHAEDPTNHDNQVDIFLAKTSSGPALPTGDWRVELRSESTQPVPFHAWIDRVARSQSTFAPADADPSHTLGSIACGHRTIAVGAYNPRGAQRPLASFTAAGPTRDLRRKPEVSAPGGELGAGILAARSLTHRLTTPMPGTSMAAPHVTGLITLLLQQAQQPLTAEEIRDALVQTARKEPPPGADWDPRYGNGCIDVSGCILSVTSSSGVAPAAAPVLPEMDHSAGILVGGNNSSPASERDILERMAAIVSRHQLRVRLQVEIEPRQ